MLLSAEANAGLDAHDPAALSSRALQSFVASELARRASPHIVKPLSERLADFDAMAASLGDSLDVRMLIDEPMSRHTTIKIGGPADRFLLPRDRDTLVALVNCAEKAGVPFFVQGWGSNTLVRDGGIRGLVISLEAMGGDLARDNEIRVLEETEESVLLEVDASASLHTLVRYAGKHGLAGLAHLAGIPASVGGALFMNAGVPAGTITDSLVALAVFRSTGKVRWIPKEKLQLSYRKNELPTGTIILAGRFRLLRTEAESVQTEIAQVLDRRRDKQPLSLPNMGSVFMNPTEADIRLASGKAKKISRDSKEAKKLLSRLPTAGELIDEAGLKNVRVGGARVSPKHANFIVNEGRATAQDVQILMRLVRDKVRELTGILLVPEVRVVGDDVKGNL